MTKKQQIAKLDKVSILLYGLWEDEDNIINEICHDGVLTVKDILKSAHEILETIEKAGHLIEDTIADLEDEMDSSR